MFIQRILLNNYTLKADYFKRMNGKLINIAKSIIGLKENLSMESINVIYIIIHVYLSIHVKNE